MGSSEDKSVTAGDWGRLVLEELLVRGALQVSPRGEVTAPVRVALDFELVANRVTGCIEARLLRRGSAAAVTELAIATPTGADFA